MTVPARPRWNGFHDLRALGRPGVVVIWDFDGVVADTEPLHEESYRALGARRGHVLADDFFLAQVGRTEPEIWASLIAAGFPGEPERMTELMAERQTEFLALAGTLPPSELAGELIPYFADTGLTQHVVSNGSADTIGRLLRVWALDSYVDVTSREPGEDKGTIFDRICSAGAPVVIFEDSPAWLARGRAHGAVTVAVRHPLNAHRELVADYTVDLTSSGTGAIAVEGAP